jgi:hypothetical protein
MESIRVTEVDTPETWSRGLRAWATGACKPRPFEEPDDFCQIIKNDWLRVYHCTRLTAGEIRKVLAGGLRCLTPELIQERVNNVVSAGELDIGDGAELERRSFADRENRRGLIHFLASAHVFRQGEDSHAIHHFFTKWGGEAISWPVEREPAEDLLREVGTPCVVIARLPVDAEYVSIRPGLALPIWERIRAIYESGSSVESRRDVPPDQIETVIARGSDEWSRLFQRPPFDRP